MFRKLILMLAGGALCSMLMVTTAYAGSIVTYQYDANNRLLSMTFQKSGVMYKTSFEYDKNGNLLSKTTNPVTP